MVSIWAMKFCRGISTSSVCCGRKNFRKFDLPNKRGTREFKERQRVQPHPDIPIDKRGTRDTGYMDGKNYKMIPEMIPELIVPDLKDFTLKPYVSYRSLNVTQSEFTAKDLFNAIYTEKIHKDFAAGKLKEDGQPIEPNEFEKLTPQQALDNATKTGCDIFTEEPVKHYVKTPPSDQ
uniref:Putative mitochondrial ribosomal protein L41 n=1 Tax=Lysiphlebus testaceipes TaxID=77504 RepID=Q56FJ5_LYSTE|nr:putative mitochondrial ribosomal protein L41 [Lysiphlebus testaceipes]